LEAVTGDSAMNTYHTTILGFKALVDYTYEPEECESCNSPGSNEAVYIDKVFIQVDGTYREVPDPEDKLDLESLEPSILKYHKS
jgi:hypothetical protein